MPHSAAMPHVCPFHRECAHSTEKDNRAQCGEGTVTHRPALQRRVANPQRIVPFIRDHQWLLSRVLRWCLECRCLAQLKPNIVRGLCCAAHQATKPCGDSHDPHSHDLTGEAGEPHLPSGSGGGGPAYSHLSLPGHRGGK